MSDLLAKLAKLLSVRVFAIGLTFLQTIVLTRVFGAELFGLLSLALTISALTVLLLSLGLDQVGMRDLGSVGPKFIIYTKRWSVLWRMVFLIIIPSTAVVVVVALLVLFNFEIAGAYTWPLIAAFFVLPLLLTRKFLEAICLGSKFVIKSIVGSQLAYPILMISGGLYVWFLGVEPNEKLVSLVYAFAIVGSLIASALMVTPLLKYFFAKKEPEVPSDVNIDSYGEARNEVILKSGVYLSLVSLCFILGQHLDVLLMGYFSSPEDVALVRIASRVAEMVGLIRAIIELHYKPLLAEAHGLKDTGLMQSHARRMVTIFCVSGVPLALMFWIFSEKAMLVFGLEFVSGSSAMRIYVVGVLVTLLFGPGASLLTMSGFESITFRILLFSLFVQFGLGMLLIPIYGILGCASANLVAMSTWAILCWFYAYRKLGVETSLFLVWFRRSMN